MQSIQWHFDWIDALVVPVTLSIMEAQPIALILLFFALLFSGHSSFAPLDSLSLTLLLLGLYWWAMLVKRLGQQGVSGRLTGLLHTLSLFVALGLVIATRQWLLDNLIPLVVMSICVLWCWQHGRSRAQIELSEEQLIVSFKVCFIVLLGELLIAVFVKQPVSSAMLTALALALPLSFVSGLIALSGVRLSFTRREYLRNPFGGSPDHIRVWLLFLALAWVVLVGITVLLETVAFQPLLALLTPLITPLIALVEDVIAFILRLFGQQTQPIKLPRRPLQPAPQYVKGPSLNLSLSPILITAIFVVAGALLLIGVLFVLREILFIRFSISSDEKRERLDARSILSERRRQRGQRNRTRFKLEPLNSDSARARYRDLLLAAARRGEPLAHRPDETPAEYQRRLQALTTSLSTKEGEPPPEAILAELTRAYTPERYGKKPVEPEQASFLKRWMPNFIRRVRNKRF